MPWAACLNCRQHDGNTIHRHVVAANRRPPLVLPPHHCLLSIDESECNASTLPCAPEENLFNTFAITAKHQLNFREFKKAPKHYSDWITIVGTKVQPLILAVHVLIPDTLGNINETILT
jgi:hypothetical protein